MFSVVLYCEIWAEQRFVSVHWLYHSQMNSAVMSAKWRVGSSTDQSGPGRANCQDSEKRQSLTASRGLLNPGKGHLKIVGKLLGVFTCPCSTLSLSWHPPWRWQQPDPNLGLWTLTLKSAEQNLFVVNLFCLSNLCGGYLKDWPSWLVCLSPHLQLRAGKLESCRRLLLSRLGSSRSSRAEISQPGSHTSCHSQAGRIGRESEVPLLAQGGGEVVWKPRSRLDTGSGQAEVKAEAELRPGFPHGTVVCKGCEQLCLLLSSSCSLRFLPPPPPFSSHARRSLSNTGWI